ncbi:MAG: hypothetical protein HC893_12245, partial [Chloroflexaceae bacterium]|nr:hypothetical protein [Chloroflexaceae bacterium]
MQLLPYALTVLVAVVATLLVQAVLVVLPGSPQQMASAPATATPAPPAATPTPEPTLSPTAPPAATPTPASPPTDGSFTAMRSELDRTCG